MEHTDLSRLDLPEERTKLNREQGGYSFYAYLSRMRYISRWGLMRNSSPENIQEHSHMVAVLAHALGLISRDIYGNTHIFPETCATVALPKTANPAHMKNNAAVDFVISQEDMDTLTHMERLEDYGDYNVFPVFSGKPLA